MPDIAEDAGAGVFTMVEWVFTMRWNRCSRWAGARIVVEDHQLVSEGEFTLEDLRFFKRWDWDYRSHSGEPGGEIVPLPQ